MDLSRGIIKSKVSKNYSFTSFLSDDQHLISQNTHKIENSKTEFEDNSSDAGNVENNETKVEIVSKRRQTCTRCRNHKLIIPKRNHKGKCMFEACKCPKCVLISERQEVLASQVRLRRMQQLIERKRDDTEQHEPFIPSTNSETPTNINPFYNNRCDSNYIPMINAQRFNMNSYGLSSTPLTFTNSALNQTLNVTSLPITNQQNHYTNVNYIQNLVHCNLCSRIFSSFDYMIAHLIEFHKVDYDRINAAVNA